MGVGLAMTALIVCSGFECSGSKPRSYGTPATLARLDDQRIAESSGVAPSQREQGVFYTHNDSGNKPCLFKFNADGKTLRTFEIEGAQQYDWEDMASATLEGKPYLFIGDVGDNTGRRKSIRVYRVPEPTGKTAKVDQTYTLEYPDGAHNCETLLVHPKTGDVTLVTKTSEETSSVFSLKRPSKTGTFKLQKVGTVAVGGSFRQARLITGGAYSQDGEYVVLRTYLGAYEFKGGSKWFQNKPVKVNTNIEAQGEAITYTLRGNAFITTSEGAPCQVSRIAIQ
jgi:hypothetical protein